MNFVEEDQVFTMEVQHQDESYGAPSSLSEVETELNDDDSEEEREVSFHDTSDVEDSSSQSSEDSLRSDEDQTSGLEDAGPSPRSRSSSHQQHECNKHKASNGGKRIKKIDKKLHQKWQERKELMEESGLEESFDQIGKTLPFDNSHPSTSRGKKRVSIASPPVVNQNVRLDNLNSNVNSNSKRRSVVKVMNPEKTRLNQSQSDETIYEQAVQTTNRSSSSSDGFIDTSDEFVNLDIDDLNIIMDEFLGEIGRGCHSPR